MAGIIEPLEPSLKFHYCIQLKNGHFFGEKNGQQSQWAIS